MANEMDIAAVTYEGGGANRLDQTAVKVAVHGCLNVLKSPESYSKEPKSTKIQIECGRFNMA